MPINLGIIIRERTGPYLRAWMTAITLLLIEEGVSKLSSMWFATVGHYFFSRGKGYQMISSPVISFVVGERPILLFKKLFFWYWYCGTRMGRKCCFFSTQIHEILMLCLLNDRIRLIWWPMGPVIARVWDVLPTKTIWCPVELPASSSWKLKTCHTLRPDTLDSNAWSTSKEPKWPSAPASRPDAMWSATRRRYIFINLSYNPYPPTLLCFSRRRLPPCRNVRHISGYLWWPATVSDVRIREDVIEIDALGYRKPDQLVQVIFILFLLLHSTIAVFLRSQRWRIRSPGVGRLERGSLRRLLARHSVQVRYPRISSRPRRLLPLRYQSQEIPMRLVRVRLRLQRSLSAQRRVWMPSTSYRCGTYTVFFFFL